ncbi:hypothetical protein LZQ00_03860 [Sphingobacterium sp. SRCM116780]|uniref:hypothetical protein n=1 Tax=Sphingobacterium sp. SRCM116780 TaxID=2907623 RepID=UPI001F411C9B|nr:hypothetical protein [Sphingobacterium sp. SRCM116780]UIR56956.1 hypothetical protein LZQ00_03860 [Sphingobacterium sp. SRCM116780]
MLNKTLEELSSEYPERCILPVSMNEPNERINIYSGNFTISANQKEYPLTGTLSFRWFPFISVEFKGSYASKERPDFKTDEYELLIDDINYGIVKLSNVNDASCSGYSRKFLWGDFSVPVTEVTFALPNMREYFGEGVKDVNKGDVKVDKARLVFNDDPYTIVLDKLADYKTRTEKLENNGGYLFQYVGKITKKKGSITLSELHKWHLRFHNFLYFLNGRRTAPFFYTGIHEGENRWTDYSGYTVDEYKYTLSWSNIIRVNSLPELWKSYNKLWKDDVDQDFLITAIHWYIEANSNTGMVEGSIILIQTALELIYNWLIVENQKIIIGDDAVNLSAANKIRLLIFQFKIDAAVPAAFEALGKLPNVKDGPEAFVKIRNALVHGQESKRIELMNISNQAKYEALQLGIWYVELALLFILGYQGKYRNRTDGNLWRNTGTYVP